MRIEYVATRELGMAGKVIKPGEVVAVLDTEHDPVRVINGLANGMLMPADPDAPKPEADPETPATE